MYYTVKSTSEGNSDSRDGTHVRIILEVPVLGVLVWAETWVGEWSVSIWVAGRDGDSGTGWSDSSLGSGFFGRVANGAGGEATSRTSFMPARTLERPEIASTLEANWTWFICKVFKASRMSFIMVAWSGGEEEDMMFLCWEAVEC
jgi:hypothetical protein